MPTNSLASLKVPFLAYFFLWCAQDTNAQNDSYYLTKEVLVGISAPSNGSFPDRSLQTQGHLHFTLDHSKNKNDWAQWLHHPRTGISIGYTNFGNNKQLDNAFSLIPPFLSLTRLEVRDSKQQ